MALPVIQGVVRCAVVGTTHGGGPWVNVWHWEYALGASTPGKTEIDALHPVFFRFYSGTAYGTGLPWLNACSASTTIQRIDYTILNGTALGYTKTASASGTGGASTMPAECAAVLTLRTDVRGRRYRGRIYLPAPISASSSLAADGTIATTTVNAALNQAAGMVTAAAAVQWRPVVASYGKSLVNDPSDPHDKIPVTWTPFATPITSFTMDNRFDVQRRRKQ